MNGGATLDGRLADYVGCACEVKTMDNDLLVVGKIRSVLDDDGQAIEITSYNGDSMPAAAYGIPIKVNIINSKHGFLSLGGKVYITHESFWRVNDISTFGENERRGYYRLKIHTLADVIGPDKANVIKNYKCLVISVSLSGILIAVDADDCYFRDETEIEVRGLRVFEAGESFNVKCTVNRIDENHLLGKLYGCRFVKMSGKESDRLCKEIFAKQRQDIQRRRGGV